MALIEHTGKPVSIEWNREWQGPNGPVHYFDIKFDDDDETEGQFSTTKKEQTKFTIGKSVKFTTEVKNNNRGEYYKIDIAKDPNAGTGNRGGGRSPNGNHGMSPEVEASITMSVCLDCAALVILKSNKADQVKDDLVALHLLATKFFNHIYEKSKGDRQLSINYQSRLKEVTTYLMDPAFTQLKITNSESILKYVDLEVSFLQMKMGEAKK
jgi:hypothetical protein